MKRSNGEEVGSNGGVLMGKFGGKLCVGVGVWPLIFLLKMGSVLSSALFSNEHGIRCVFSASFFFCLVGGGVCGRVCLVKRGPAELAHTSLNRSSKKWSVDLHSGILKQRPSQEKGCFCQQN